MSPIFEAFEAKAQAEAGRSAAQWLWTQSGLLNANNMKMKDMAEVMAFITGRLAARADVIENEMNRAASPFLWPFSTQSENTLYPDYTSDELMRVRERQMSACMEPLRSYVLGDIWAQASDSRAVEKLGDGKEGSIGEAGNLLKGATKALEPVMSAYGSRATTGTPKSGGSMLVTTHCTAPAYPNGFSR